LKPVSLDKAKESHRKSGIFPSQPSLGVATKEEKNCKQQKNSPERWKRQSLNCLRPKWQKMARDHYISKGCSYNKK
jgi:hypothetical protein